MMIIMWNNFIPEEMVGSQKIIDKVDLIQNFLNDEYCVETPLISRDDLSIFLKREILSNFGVYCLYNQKTQEVLYVGKSKRLKERIKNQLIGVKNRKTGLLQFTRLFPAVLKVEKEMLEKTYNAKTLEEKKKYVDFYQSIIYRPGNFLRVCSSINHINAIVLEDILIGYFKQKKQCKYNFQT